MSYSLGRSYSSSVRGGAATGVAGAASNILFRWNGVDTSQFAVAQDYSLVGTGPTLSFLSTRRDTTFLRMSSGAGTFTGGRIFFINGVTFPPRYVVSWHILRDSQPGTSDRFTTVVLCNGLTGASMYGIGIEIRTTATTVCPQRYDAGARVGTPTMAAVTGAGTTADRFGAYYYYTVECEPFPVGAAPPEFGIFGHAWGYNTTTTGGDAAQSQEQVGWPAGWDGQTLDRIGIGMFHTANVAHEVDIAELIVYQHPKDYPL